MGALILGHKKYKTATVHSPMQNSPNFATNAKFTSTLHPNTHSRTRVPRTQCVLKQWVPKHSNTSNMRSATTNIYLYKCSRSGPEGSHALLGLFGAFAQDGSKRLKKAQEGAKGLKKALEKAVRACPVPPVRPKRLFEPASVPPVRSKRLFETAVRDHYSKVLGSATLCSEPLYSALLCSVHVYARVHTRIHIYIYGLV